VSKSDYEQFQKDIQKDEFVGKPLQKKIDKLNQDIKLTLELTTQ
jgi:hypothetical protein